MTDKKGVQTSFERLPDAEAIAHFNAKTLITSGHYAEIKAYEHALAFTVAKIADQDMLTEVHKAMRQAIENGTPFHEFQKNLRPYLMAKGWLDLPNTKDGKKELGSRLRTIYDTNKHTAHAAGKWERIQRTKDRFTHLQYMPSKSTNKRDMHATYYGMVRSVDDPIWQSIFPPNGFGCKCWVKQLTTKEAQKILDEQAEKGIVYDIEMEDIKHPLTGEMMSVPKGVHFSFNHNHDRLTALLKLAEDKHGNLFAKELAKQALNIDVVRKKFIIQWVAGSSDLYYSEFKGKYAKIVKECNLTLQEFMAIRHYTGRSYWSLNQLYNHLSLVDWGGYLSLESARYYINNGLVKMPAYKGVLTRTVRYTDDQLSQFEIGKTITLTAFTSATYRRHVVAVEKDYNTILQIYSKTGRMIESISLYPKQKEVLYGSPTTFVVQDIKFLQADGVFLIELRELGE